MGDPTSKSLGVTVLDYNGDGWPDLFVANDTQPNKLYRNNRNGTFTEEGMAAGVAYGEDGVARGAMGADAADYDRSGRPHLLVGNFSNQMLGLYHNEGNGLFVDEAPSSTVGRASLLSLTFGVFFFDYDLDGYPDIFAANGHIEEEIGRVQPKVQLPRGAAAVPQPGQAQVRECDRRRWARPSTGPMVARGAAYADFDRDGDLDVLISHQQRPGLPVPQRWRQPQPLAVRAAGGNEVEPRRHRRRGARGERFGETVEHGAQRLQLLLAERPGADVRPGQGHRRRRCRWSGRAGPGSRSARWRPISS